MDSGTGPVVAGASGGRPTSGIAAAVEAVVAARGSEQMSLCNSGDEPASGIVFEETPTVGGELKLVVLMLTVSMEMPQAVLAAPYAVIAVAADTDGTLNSLNNIGT